MINNAGMAEPSQPAWPVKFLLPRLALSAAVHTGAWFTTIHLVGAGYARQRMSTRVNVNEGLHSPHGS